MSERKPLKRVEKVYGLIEKMHSIALQQAAGRVLEAEAAMAGQCSQVQEAALDRRTALLEGDLELWLIAGLQTDLSAERWRALDAVRLEREEFKDKARVLYSFAHMKTEQVKSVVARDEAAEQIVEGRRTQNATDDRHLSRLRWNELRFGTESS